MDGDKNTTFFHRVQCVASCHSSIDSLSVDGEICENMQRIQSFILGFYKNLFSDTRDGDVSQLLACISELLETKVTPNQNKALISCPTEEEIRSAIFTLSPNSSLGPDGFGGAFFQVAWDIIKNFISKKYFFLYS